MKHINSPDNQRRFSPASLLRIIVPLAITVLLVWYMLKHIDLGQLWQTVRHGVDYKWILLAMLVSVFSHIFRALRWRLQLKAIGVNPPLLALCCSIFGTYALNLVFPRLGEVWRCTYIANRQKAPLSKIVGSMVADRLSDTLTVFLILMLTLGLAHSQIVAFLDKYPIGADLLNMLSSLSFWLISVAVMALIITLFYFLRNTKAVHKMRSIVSDVWGGFAAIIHMKGRGKFGFYTLCIWGCYFLQLYFAFFAFPCTYSLITAPGTAFGLLPCLVAFVLSSIGMAVPSNGGLGPWNVCIIFALSMYGIATEPATAMSIVVWSSQTIMLIILGIFTAIYTARKTKS
ncbi:MAG: flippase-like domain-containing protein [Prevotella sp.]|nr:flippase-like domain-containing protein [Prevotella sp.]MCM1075591.1 flippase-like domain-containing protein [Ruminococcus sp.]